MSLSLTAAFLAGVLSFLSPASCPSSPPTSSTWGERGRPLFNALFFILGFGAVFFLLGLPFTLLGGSSLSTARPWPASEGWSSSSSASTCWA